MKISSMGDRHEAAHEAPPPGLPHKVGEVRTALRDLEAPSPCMGRVGVGRGSALPVPSALHPSPSGGNAGAEIA
ncbi:hypothetical protein GALL_294760 [mine drainage metagenome]|uniref:Uncharacterized protein n=1 Tax=mine drainage metagenome TaxID=410659 RepID=A0A1J5RKI5_9ZZZZ